MFVCVCVFVFQFLLCSGPTVKVRQLSDVLSQLPGHRQGLSHLQVGLPEEETGRNTADVG